MIHVVVEGKVIALPGDVLAREVLGAMPKWLFGPTENGQQAILKSGVKGLLPMLLTFIHREIVAKGSSFPMPDLKSPAAKADIISYAANYLIGSMAAAADEDRFIAEGVTTRDGSFLVQGFVAATPYVDAQGGQGTTASPSAAAATADHVT